MEKNGKSSEVANTAHVSEILKSFWVAVIKNQKFVNTLAMCDMGSTVLFIECRLTSMWKRQGKKLR